MRKLRWAGSGRGERGGLRVIYFWWVAVRRAFESAGEPGALHTLREVTYRNGAVALTLKPEP